MDCVCCDIKIAEREAQRSHYQSDWHRYNLKRKIASLPPISFEDFEAKISGINTTTKTLPQKQDTTVYKCDLCNKKFSHESTLQSHLESKKHKTRQEEGPKVKSSVVVTDSVIKNDAKLSREMKKKLQEAANEHEIWAILEEKVNQAPSLDPNKDCLFCEIKSENLEANVDHMTGDHSFFIPDIEYLVDLSGLIKYLGEKITKKNWCIFCNGTGKIFHSIEAVRKHMADKGHQKMVTEGDAELEYSDFYDFTETWENYDDEEGEWEEVEGDGDDDSIEEIMEKDDGYDFVTRNCKTLATLSSDENRLILPRGHSAINRDLVRYYKQRFRVKDERESEIVARLAERYNDLQISGRGVVKVEAYSQRKINFIKANSAMRVGVKSNKLQKYFREQMLQ